MVKENYVYHLLTCGYLNLGFDMAVTCNYFDIYIRTAEKYKKRHTVGDIKLLTYEIFTGWQKEVRHMQYKDIRRLAIKSSSPAICAKDLSGKKVEIYKQKIFSPNYNFGSYINAWAIKVKLLC